MLSQTVQRRMRELGIKSYRYSDISDDQLDEIVSSMIQFQPAHGIRTVQSRLRASGFILQRERVREYLYRVDPSGIEARLRRTLHRRQYSVPGPNSLWHIDGYHKLIRWRIVVHGGIDGYSRIPVYLNVSSNNRADTVFRAFSGAVSKFGLPSRVRADHGGENVLVGLVLGLGLGLGIEAKGPAFSLPSWLAPRLLSTVLCFFWLLAYL